MGFKKPEALSSARLKKVEERKSEAFDTPLRSSEDDYPEEN
jgi:hypothetical protein